MSKIRRLYADAINLIEKQRELINEMRKTAMVNDEIKELLRTGIKIRDDKIIELTEELTNTHPGKWHKTNADCMRSGGLEMPPSVGVGPHCGVANGSDYSNDIDDATDCSGYEPMTKRKLKLKIETEACP